MSGLVSRLRIRRFSHRELSELAHWQAVSSRHGWSVGDGDLSPVETDEEGDYGSLYLDAVFGGPVYFVRPIFAGWSLVNGRGVAQPFISLRAALEHVCPTGAVRPLTRERRPSADVISWPMLGQRPRLVSPPV
jgi:hypothetical protein